MSPPTPPHDDATEALLDKMSKDSFPASDPPALQSSPSADEIEQRRARTSGVPAATLDLGEEVAGQGPERTLVLGGRDAAVLRLVADDRRMQLALAQNPLEMNDEDARLLIAALERFRGRLRGDPAA